MANHAPYDYYESSDIIHRTADICMSSGKPRDYGNGELYTSAELHILKYLVEHPGITATQFALEWNKTRGAVVQMITKLEKAGANRWTKYGKDRMYLRNVGKAVMALECTYYKTGNISSATLDGEEISNGAAGRVVATYNDAYIDMTTGKVYGVSDRGGYADTFESKLATAFRA